MRVTFELLIFVLGLWKIEEVCGMPKQAALLAPPDEEKGDEDEEAARGLKGQANPLASLQKSHTKCTVEGAYGIKNECSKYVDCQKKGLIPATKYCPSGKFFDHKKRMCVKSSDAQCKNVCAKDGLMLPDPTNDKIYLKCLGGVPLPYNCPEGKTYNKATSSC